MILSQELIPVDTLVEAGEVTILALAVLVGAFSFFYTVRSFLRKDSAEDEITTKLVTLTANAISNTEKLTEALDRNTTGYEGLADALKEFKVGIETKLDENTKAINDLATELREGRGVSVKALVGLSVPVELSDGTIYTISVIEENEQVKIKLTKQEKAEDGDRAGTTPQ